MPEGNIFGYKRPTKGYQGYGLFVTGKYEDDEWLKKSNKEWVILYHSASVNNV